MPDRRMLTASRIVKSILDSLRKWERADAIRRKLPARYAGRIPASRAFVLRSLLTMWKQRGWIGPPPEGYGTPALVWVLVVGGLAVLTLGGAVAIMAYQNQARAEANRAAEAERAADVQLRLWQQEQQDAARVGADAARQAAAQRAEEWERSRAGLLPSVGPSLLPGGGGAFVASDPGIEPPSEGFLARLGIGKRYQTAAAGLAIGSLILLAFIASRR